jgi:hypothetical protein
MTETPLLAAIRDALRRDHVSFAELSRIEGFRGDLQMMANADRVSNVVIWGGVSRAAIEALEIIRKEGEYELAPASFMTYLIDGVTLNLPIAKQIRHYKNPHWAPMVLSRKTGSRRPRRPQPR